MKPIEFVWGEEGRRLSIEYVDGKIILREYIEDRHNRKYWRSIPCQGRSRSFYNKIVAGRSKKDFERMAR